MLEWDRRYIAAAGVILLILGGVFGLKYSDHKQRQRLLEETVLPVTNLAVIEEEKEEEAGEIVVYVGGAVQNPGIYTLLLGARVHEAVLMAVPLEEADLDVIGMARPLEDGETLYIPVRGEAGAETGAVWTGSSSAAGKININRASAEELAAGLPGIGEAIARRIVDYRTANGNFSSPDELQKVSGIGEKKYAAIEALITVR
jgi:competence protein ComEA